MGEEAAWGQEIWHGRQHDREIAWAVGEQVMAWLRDGTGGGE